MLVASISGDGTLHVFHAALGLLQGLKFSVQMDMYSHACRNNALLALPPELRMAAIQPVQGEWSLKMLPPFASPPRAPKWRM